MTEIDWTQHNKFWQPTCGAHRIAKYLEAIAACLPDIVSVPAALEAYMPGLSNDPTLVPQISLMLQRKATLLRAACPLPTTPTEAQRDEFVDGLVSMYADDQNALQDWIIEAHTDADILEERATAEITESQATLDTDL